LNFSAVRPGIYCVKFTYRIYLEDGRADGTNEGTLDTSGEFAVVPPEAITVGSNVGNELGEINGSTDGRDDGRLDGTDKGVSVGSSLGVSLVFRLDKVDGSTDGTDDGKDDEGKELCTIDGYNSLGTADRPIVESEILGKKDGTADGKTGSSDWNKEGTIDGAQLGKTVGPGFRLGKVKRSTDGIDDGRDVGRMLGCSEGIILKVDEKSVGSLVGPILGIKLDGT